jgi:hypothetical protein
MSSAISSTHPDLPPAFHRSSTLMHSLHFTSLPSLLSSPCSARLDILFIFVTAAVLFSAFLVISKTVSTLTHKICQKNEATSYHLNSTTMQGNTLDSTQRLWHTQYMQHTASLVFDPGGLVVVSAPHDNFSQAQVKDDHELRLHHPRRRLFYLHFL